MSTKNAPIGSPSRKRKRDRRNERPSSDYYSSDDDSSDEDEEEAAEEAAEEKRLQRLSFYEAYDYHQATGQLDPRVYESSVIKRQDLLLRSMIEKEFEPYTGETNDKRFQQVDQMAIETALDVFELDKIIGIGYRFNMDALCGGGMKFSHGDRQMRESAHLWNARVYTQLMRDAMQHEWGIGFFPHINIPNESHVAEPCRLNLRLCTSHYYTNLFGKTIWVYKRIDSSSYDIGGIQVDLSSRGDNGSGKGRRAGFPVYRKELEEKAKHAGAKSIISSGSEIIPGVVTETVNPPVHGQLRSLLESLMEDSHWLQLLRECCAIAIQRRAVPGFVTQAQVVRDGDKPSREFKETPRGTVVHDRDNDTEMEQHESGLASRGGGIHQYGFNTYNEASRAMKLINMMGGNTRDLDLILRTIEARRSSRTNSTFGPHVELPEGETIAKAPESQEPGHFKEWMEMHAKHCLVSLGLPATLLDPKGHVTVDARAQEVWKQHQQARKHQMMKLLTEVYNRAHRAGHLQDYVRRTVDKLHRELDNEGKVVSKVPGERELLEQSSVKITVFGIPDDQVMDRLYRMGTLNYGSFVEYLSSHHDLPHEQFKKKPEVSVMDLLTGGKRDTEEAKMEQDDSHLKMQMKQEVTMAKMAEQTAIKTAKISASSKASAARGAGGKPAKKKAKT